MNRSSGERQKPTRLHVCASLGHKNHGLRGSTILQQKTDARDKYFLVRAISSDSHIKLFVAAAGLVFLWWEAQYHAAFTKEGFTQGAIVYD